jgi:hypothetical protein
VAAITWANVLALPNLPASPFTNPGVSSFMQTSILAYVNSSDGATGLDPNAYDGEGGADLNLARLYCAAHLALVSPITGILTGTKEDDLADTYALPPIPPGSAFWATTRFGLAFWQLTISMPGVRMPLVT